MTQIDSAESEWLRKMNSARPAEVDLSVVVPVFNEEESLAELHARLTEVLDQLAAQRGVRSEIVLVDDGSRDRSLEMIQELSQGDRRLRHHSWSPNRGQFDALMAGLAMARGGAVVTLDADLQNPPEEIPHVLQALEEGHDLVLTYRADRQDSFFRRRASKLSNRLSSWLAGRSVRDHGCMLRGYSRALIERMDAERCGLRFITALALLHTRHPTQFPADHAPRRSGQSSYSLWRLVRYQMDAAISFARARRARRRLASRL